MSPTKQSVLCYDGITRTGRVVYIHPNNVYRVQEFTGKAGAFREAILIDRSNVDVRTVRSLYSNRTAHHRCKKRGAK